MELAFLSPLYEHPGSWASAYVGTSVHTEDQRQRRRLRAEAVTRELARQGADEPTCRAVQDALEGQRHAPEPHGRAVFGGRGGQPGRAAAPEVTALYPARCRNGPVRPAGP